MLVSVIIPCYNVQDYIEECLESVYKQTYLDIEIICVDNNSTDRTYSILEKHELAGKIKLYKEIKKGALAARNLGLKHAKGEWIQFLDADDLLLPNKISNQIGLIKANRQTGIVAGASQKLNINKNSKIIYPLRDKFLGLLKTNLGNTCANLFHRLSLLDVAGWNEKIESSQEYDLMFRLVKNGNELIFDNKPLTIIRERESGQISHRNPIKKWNQYVNLRLEIIDFSSMELAKNLDHFLKIKERNNDFRQGVSNFWKENFDAEKNYSLFANNLINFTS